jgi:NAD-dependent deacetylase
MPAALDRIVVLTGAGISAESGIRTFRDQGGLWENHRIEEVASWEGFVQNPALVQSFYNDRRAQLRDSRVEPNPAHRALARLEHVLGGGLLVVTQNVDDLHERAGSRNVVHMHGELLKARCLRTGTVFAWPGPIAKDSLCECCQLTGTLRPHIVWFGEVPLELDRIAEALARCEVFVAIGTSGQVYPAAGFVRGVSPRARTIEVNLQRSALSDRFLEHRVGPASQEVPALVEELLKAPPS